MNRSQILAFLEISLPFLMFLCLLLLVGFASPKSSFIYDEIFFVRNLPLVEKYGISDQLFQNLSLQMPGPLYQIIHYCFKYLSNYSPIGMRVVNCFFYFLIVFISFKSLAILKLEKPFSQALKSIFIPAVWVIVGMTLSEIPAILICTISILFLFYSNLSKNEKKSYFLCLISGILMSIAIMGRTQFLVLIIPCCLLLFSNPRHAFLKVMTFGILALSIPMYMFYLWKGLVPPDGSEVQSGFNLWYGLIGLGYLAVFTLIVQPTWYQVSLKNYRFAAICSFVFLPLNLLLFKVEFLPLRGILTKLSEVLSINIETILAFIFPVFLLFIGVLYLICAITHVYKLNFNN